MKFLFWLLYIIGEQMLKKILAFIIFLAIGLIIVALLSSCSETKKLQRAENRVLANIESVEKVGRVFSDLHPCVPDSVVTVIPGKIDTLTNTVTDTVITVVPNIITKTITRTIKKVDTVQIAVRDNRMENILQKDNEKLQAKALQFQTESLNSQQKYFDEKKNTTKWKWYAIGTWCLIGAAGIGYFLIKLKVI